MATLLNEISQLKQLRSAWLHIYKNKKVTPGYDDETIEDFARGVPKNLKLISKELKNKQYIFNKVILSSIPKRHSKKRREISIFTIRDKIVQKTIEISLTRNRENGTYFPEIRNDVSIGFVKKFSNSETNGVKKSVEIVKKNYQKGYLFLSCGDIENFFPSIDKKRLYSFITSRLEPDRSINWLIKGLMDPVVGRIDRFEKKNSKFIPHKTFSGITQGSILSPFFSNLYLLRFDTEVQKTKIPVLRYADDIAFFSKRQSDAIKNKRTIENLLYKYTRLKFHTSKKKRVRHYPLSNPAKYGEYLGIKYKRVANKWSIEPVSSKQKELNDVIYEELLPINVKTLSDAVYYLNRCIASWFNFYAYVGCTKKILKSNFYDMKLLYERRTNALLISSGITRENLTPAQLGFLGVMTFNKLSNRKR